MSTDPRKPLVTLMLSQGFSYRKIRDVTGASLGSISAWAKEQYPEPVLPTPTPVCKTPVYEGPLLIIGDLHLPCEKYGYLEFCLDIQKKYGTTQTIFIGDVLEHGVITFHAKHPKAPGAVREYEMMRERILIWHDAFPNARVLKGNHDERPNRVAKSIGIPPEIYLKSYSEVWGTETWEWDFSFEQDGIIFLHGDGYGGKYPYATASHALGRSVVIGHCHSVAGIYWNVSSLHRWFGMSVGTGIDESTIRAMPLTIVAILVENQ
jgi:predicted phosphodiesterase